MSQNELTKKVRELKELKAMQEELSEAITTIEDEIKAVMTAQNTETLKADIFTIRWTTVSSTRFDSTSFKKANPDMYKLFSREVQTRRFSVA